MILLHKQTIRHWTCLLAGHVAPGYWRREKGRLARTCHHCGVTEGSRDR